MRILVLSDSHGSRRSVENAIEQQPDAKNVIFLGDGADDIESAGRFFTDRSFYIVCGNCDFSPSYLAQRLLNIGGKRIFICHGHTYGVKHGYEKVIEAAKLEKADILLFGHTHVAYTSYLDGMYIMNPGSLSRPNDIGGSSYGYIDITPSGIMPVIVR